MQLNKAKSIRGAVTALTATLLGSSLAAGAGLNQSETTFLVYSEKDRVKTTEGIFSLTQLLKHDYTLGLHFTYDGLTGATPTGAAPSKNPQTLTRASGGSGFTVPAGQLPTDHMFKDSRFGLDATLSHAVGKLWNLTLASHASSEHDYTSLGGSASITHDLNNRNTTIGLEAGYSHDVSTPVGGLPQPFAAVVPPGDAARADFGTSESRQTYDLGFSLTQVVDQKTLARLSYTFDRSSGYLTDPYKILSLVQGPDSANAGEPVESVYENRPRSRTKNAVYGQIRRFLLGCAMDGSYRYFWDDWGITSHTVDFSTKIGLKSKGAVQPHVRWYQQSRADFYHPFLIQGNPFPAYASADGRLADFHAFTVGLGYSIPVGATYRLNVVGERYFQRGDPSPPEAFGSQSSFNLFPDLNATLITFGLVHTF